MNIEEAMKQATSGPWVLKRISKSYFQVHSVGGKLVLPGLSLGIAKILLHIKLLLHWFEHGPKLLEALEQVLHEVPTSNTMFVKWARKRIAAASEVEGI